MINFKSISPRLVFMIPFHHFHPANGADCQSFSSALAIRAFDFV